MPPRRLPQLGAAIALFFILVLLIVGCGTELTTAPQPSAIQQDVPGEVIIPEPNDAKLSMPRDFLAQPLTGHMVLLTWTVPDNPCEAVILLDGDQIVMTSAASGSYVDATGKTTGSHVYQLQYCIGVRLGPAVQQAVNLVAPLGGDGLGRRPPQPERTD